MKLVFVILFICVIKWTIISAGCNCGRHLGKPIVNFIGDACVCGRPLPYTLEKPVPPLNCDCAHRDHGYDIDYPQPNPIDLKYNFDFHTEKPVIKSNYIESRNYGYNIYAPPPPVPTIKYNFDAHIEVPVPAAQCLPLEGLVSQIDKIVLPKPDCDIPVPGDCPCRSCKPIIETIGYYPKSWPSCGCHPSCPYHANDHSYHDIPSSIGFPSRYDNHLTNDKLLNDHDGIPYEGIFFLNLLKNNFDNKELINEISVDNNPNEIKNRRVRRSASPNPEPKKLQSFRITKKCTRKCCPMTIMDKIETKRLFKRSLDSDEDINFEKDMEENSCKTLKNLKKRNNLNYQREEIFQYLPELLEGSDDYDDSKGLGRNCGKCRGEMKRDVYTGNRYCPDCLLYGCTPHVIPVHNRPQFIEYNLQGDPIVYVPRKEYHSRHPLYQQNPPAYHSTRKQRIVYDQLGHKYLEKNGNLKIIPPDYISYARDFDEDEDYSHDNDYDDEYEKQIYLNKISQILYHHPDFHKWQLKTNKEKNIAPPVLEQQRSFIEFLRDIVRNRYNDPDNIPKTIDDNHDLYERNDKSNDKNDEFVQITEHEEILNDKNDFSGISTEVKVKDGDEVVIEINSMESDHLKL